MGKRTCCWWVALGWLCRAGLAAEEVDLRAEALDGTSVRLAWTRPATAVSGWRLTRNGQPLGDLPAGQQVFLDTQLTPATLYRYTLTSPEGVSAAPAALVTGPPNEVARLRPGQYDVVVYGATPAGLAAALALGRQGRRVALVEPTIALGGLMTGGLTRTDFGSIHALGGPFREFMRAVDRDYSERYPADSPNQAAKRGGLYFEPSVARRVFLSWLAAEPRVTVLRLKPLAGVRVTDGVLRAAVFDDPSTRTRWALTADVFIDASYEGDLAAAAGCEYLLGRESHAQFNETHAGKLWWDVWQRKVVAVPGDGDRHVQAYNYRLCLTRDPALRVAPPGPDVYRRAAYVGLLPDIAKGRLKKLDDVLSILPVPNGKWDANNHPQGNPSSDLVGASDRWPEATGAQRAELAEAHRQHLLGLLWFLRWDPEVPESLRRDTAEWGLARDEFPEQHGWSSALYVREGRRILGEYVFTEHDAMAAPGGERPTAKRDSIAVGAYPIDSHATGGRHPEHPDWLEGFFYLARGETKPYGIPYRVMLPKGVDGLLVAAAVSSTHVGYGSLRMEPVFMSLGLAAGLAADEALRAHVPPREVAVARLQARLLAADQVVTVFEDVDFNTPGRAGFNLWGAFGAFPTYFARPAEPLTAGEWRAWLTCCGWPEFAAGCLEPVTADRPLLPGELQESLRRLATALAVPVPTVTQTRRDAAMAGLWSVTEAWLLGATAAQSAPPAPRPPTDAR